MIRALAWVYVGIGTIGLTALSVTADGTRLFAAGGALTMRTLPTNAALWQIASARDNVVAASPDGRSVASGALVSSGFHPTTIEALAFAPSGRTVLSGGIAGELVLWSI